MNFAELQLEPSLLESIQKLGYTECTPIQEQALPPILEGRDVSGLAQTGTGKTAAFVIPLLDRILKGRKNTENLSDEEKQALAKRSFHDWRPRHFVLVLVPTRELADQVDENIKKLGTDSGFKSHPIYGGTGYDKQIDALRSGLDFIVATPGRLIDLYKENHIDMKLARAIVFDEADRMFDMGFKDDMKFILSRIPKERQFLVFSATLNFDVLNTAYQFGADPVEINVSRDQTKAENVKDTIFHTGGDEKPRLLLSLLKKHQPKQAIIFSNYKHNVDRIARFLTLNGVPGMGISSLLTQAQRNRVIEQFKADNDQNIMVATDVAARGLDIKGVDLVINYDLPSDSETYVHRIGRTGRAGTMGTAFSMVGDKDVESLVRLEEFLKHKLEVGWMEDADLIKTFEPMQEDRGSRGNDRGGFDRGARGPGGGGNRDRGPRRDGPPRRDGGGDRGPRPPRREGERRDSDQRDNRGPAQAGERRPDNRGGQRPPRDPNQPQGQGRHQQNGQRNNNSNQRQGQQRRDGHQANGQRGPQQHRNQNGPRHQQRPGGGSAQRPRSNQPAPKTVVAKIGKFFKNLFGSDQPTKKNG